MLLHALLVASLATATFQDQAAPAAERPSEGTLIVLNKADASAWLLDAGDGSVRAKLATGAGPHEAAVSPDGALAVVCDYGEQQPGSTLTVIDVAAGKVARTIDLGADKRPHGILFDGPQSVLVTVEAVKALVRVDLAAGKVSARFPTGQEVSHMVALEPGGARAWVANIGSGTVTLLDLGGEQAARHVSTGKQPEGLALAREGRELWVGNRAEHTLSVLDTKSLEVLATLPCAGFPIRVVLTPDGRRALSTCAESGELAVFDVEARKESKRIALHRDGETASPQPVGVLVPPSGKRAYVALCAQDQIAVIDLEQLAVLTHFATGKVPDGMAWSPKRVAEPKR